MDLEGLALRILRAAGYSLAAAAAGLFLTGANYSVITSIAAAIAVSQLLNVMTYWASVSAALLILWGGLTAANITPGTYSVVPLKNHLVELANEVRSKETKPNNPSSVIADTRSMAKDDMASSLSIKLEDLKEACEKKILTPRECDTTWAKIIAYFAK